MPDAFAEICCAASQWTSIIDCERLVHVPKCGIVCTPHITTRGIDSLEPNIYWFKFTGPCRHMPFLSFVGVNIVEGTSGLQESAQGLPKI